MTPRNHRDPRSTGRNQGFGPCSRPTPKRRDAVNTNQLRSARARATLAMFGLVPLALVSCDKGSADKGTGDKSGASPTPAKTLKLAFVTNTVSDFWKIATAGIHKYEKENKVQVDVKMPPNG